MLEATEKQLGDKTIKLVFDDGRHFVRTTQEKYDVITSDPIDPWVKGCAALNTVEYYQMCKDKLNDGGVMTLWIPLYESNEDTFKSVLTTFFEVFPNGILWSNDYAPRGTMPCCLASRCPRAQDPAGYELDVDRFVARLDRPDHAGVMQSLREVGFDSGLDLLATYAGRAADLEHGGWTDRKVINRDRNLRLQYLAGMWFNSYLGTEILGTVLKHYRYPTDLFVGHDDELRETLRTKLADGGRVENANPQHSTHAAPQAKVETPIEASQ